MPRAVVASLLLVFLCACPPASRPDDGTPPVSADSGGGTPDAGQTACGAGELPCGGTCTPVVSDPKNCGGCGLSCGATQVCSNRACIAAPNDCRVSGATCPAHSWCSPVNGHCEAGCQTNADCDRNGFCEGGSHQCRCNQGLLQCGTACVSCQPPAHAQALCSGSTCDFRCDSGYHRCGTRCLANTSTDGCGQSCAACPAPAGGSATCDGQSCGVACPGGTLLCAGACAACPTGGVAQTACSGSACVATSCAAGYALTANGCERVWSLQTLGTSNAAAKMAVTPSGTPLVAWSYTTSTSAGYVKLWKGSGSATPYQYGRVYDLAADSQGHAHLLVGNFGLTWLEPGVNSGIPVTSDTAQDPVLALAPGDLPVVASNTGSGMYLPKVYTRTTSAWTTDTLSYSLQISGQQIALSPQGQPVVLLETQSGRYRLATKAATGWSVDSSDSYAFNPSLAVRSDGKVVVASASTGSNAVQLASPGNYDSIPTGLVQPYWVALALDAHDEAHVAFSSSNTGVYYAAKRSGAWAIEQISSEDSYGAPTIRVDAQGAVHVAYTTHATMNVVYAHRQ